MKQTISRILILRIAITVICVNLLIGLGFYALSARHAENDFQNNIKLQAKHLGDAFSQQLWLFDLSSAEHLANLALDSPEIVGLRLTDYENQVLIEKGLFNVEKSLRNELRFEEDALVGYLELAFTDPGWKRHKKEILLASVSMVGATILLTFLIIAYLLDRHLTRPLRALQKDMDSLADGQLEPSKHSSKAKEIDSIINAFNKMTVALAERDKQRDSAESERKGLENQLYQAQKIESVGRLAGGVAHDYNNMLSVIIGYTELAKLKVDQSSPLGQDLKQVLLAANRSRDITRQLLAFARQQIISPKVLDMNIAVENMLMMLRNLLGENIDLSWHPKGDLWPVEIDPSQLDQILANLCVNARDAITDTGKMTIETDQVSLDQAYCDEHTGFIAGDFVLLIVSDNGCGMDSETLENIYEPFFTTKPLGEGTGLGLSTVYGIVKQSNGFISVYSEQGKGTTFKIFLRRYTGLDVAEHIASDTEVFNGRGETVLLVEDEISIADMAKKMLEDLGYKVLATNSPEEALSIAEACQGDIQLLLTDVVMPEMNGRELADLLLSRFPHIKCLYMSGYTANVIVHHGVLDKGINFMHKPFSRSEVSTQIRKALD